MKMPALEQALGPMEAVQQAMAFQEHKAELQEHKELQEHTAELSTEVIELQELTASLLEAVEQAVAPATQAEDDTNRSSPHPASEGEANTADGGLRIFNMAGSLMLHISEDDIEWPEDCFPRALELGDVLRFCKLDMNYTCLYPIGSTEPVEECATLDWGQDYSAITTACPRCTCCNGRCTRAGTHHILCSHSPPTGSADHVHLWHDLRRRAGPRRRSTGRLQYTVQGYLDGACLNEELSEVEIRTEIFALVREWRSSCDSAGSLEAIHAWRQRTPTGFLRGVLDEALLEPWP